MTDPSLNRRLDHHARRSGFAVGASMAVAIVLLIGAFVWLFATINPYLSDFIGAEAASTQPPTVAAVQPGGQVTPTAQPAQPTATVAVTPTSTASIAPSSNASASDAAASDGANVFEADYQIGPVSINFRPSPGTTGANPIAVLDPGVPLQSTGKKQTVEGSVWIELTDQEGRTGWIREIDVQAI